MANVGEAVRRLQRASVGVGPEQLPDALRDVASLVDATEIVIYLADYAQTDLLPLGRPDRDALPIDTTLAGRAFASLEVQRAPEGPDRLWIPLVDGCERLGVLEVVSPSAGSGEAVAAGEALAVAVTQLVKVRRVHGDLVERLRRRAPMHVAAEIVWGLLPPLTFATDDLLVTAILEPCYDVGGDVFDYALNGDVLSLGLFDTTGHGIKASTLASLTVNAYRNARRGGLDLADTAVVVDGWLRSEHPGRFATAVLAELDRTTGRLRTVNAGHPGPLLIRDGKAVKELPGPTWLPLGLNHLTGRAPTVVDEHLQPGDRVLAYTDGVTDAVDARGEHFGAKRLADLVERGLHDELAMPETMRRLVQAVVAHQVGRLTDDATALLLEWRPTRSPLRHVRKSSGTP
jgi:hypothetical protein